MTGTRSTFGGVCGEGKIEVAEGVMPTAAKETKGVGKALINA